MPGVTISMNLLSGTGTYALISAIAGVHPGFVGEILERIQDPIIFCVQNDQEISGFIDLKNKNRN